MKKTSSYTKMTKVKSNKKSAGEAEVPSGFTGIASGSTSMLKTQSANLKPLAWNASTPTQNFTKIR